MIWEKKDNDCSTVEDIINKRMIKYAHIPTEDEPLIHNLDNAAAVIKYCIDKKMPITIVGDYDCDGITSSSILKLGLRELGVEADVIIPKRYSEGYGLNMSIVDRINQGLMITVDNGISAVEQIKVAREKGLIVVVIDHHLRRDDNLVPNANVIVDPSAEDESIKGIYREYCGAGLAYRLVKKLNPATKLNDELIALAGIGTVADVMLLVGDNKRIVLESLKNVAQKKVPYGLRLLLDQMGIDEYVDEVDYGFKIGPTFNASGRLLDDGGQRIVNFITIPKNVSDEVFLKTEANNLIFINEQRKEVVFDDMKKVNELIFSEDLSKFCIIEDDSFLKGIVGILAGKITEKYKIPAIVLTRDKKNPTVLTGSGRSPENLNLKSVLDKCADLFIGYGGHSGAAGMSLFEDNLELLKKRFNEILSDYKPDNKEIIYYDLEINNQDDAINYLNQLKNYAPYGNGNERIVFRLDNFTGIPQIMGRFKNHLKFVGNKINALGFDLVEKWDKEERPISIDIIGSLSVNHFNNTDFPQIEIIDFKKKTNKKTDDYIRLSEIIL